MSEVEHRWRKIGKSEARRSDVLLCMNCLRTETESSRKVKINGNVMQACFEHPNAWIVRARYDV